MKRKILYLGCLLTVLGINIFYVEYQVFIMLMLIIAIPLCSWIMYVLSAAGLGISLQVKQNIVVQGNKVKIRLIKRAKSNLSFVNGTINIKYKYYHTGDEFHSLIRVKSGLSKSAGVIELPADFCGYMYIGVESIDISDYLGFFHMKKDFAGMSSVCIIPEDVPVQIQWTDGVYSKDDENISLHFKNAGDEITELREYRDGDSPRIIHWKKSSILPEDDFIVKEYNDDVLKTLIIVVDTGYASGKKQLIRMNRIYKRAFSQGLEYLKSGVQCEFAGWDEGAGEIVEYRFSDRGSCMSAIMGIMHLKCSDNAVNKVCQDLYKREELEMISEPVIITDNND